MSDRSLPYERRLFTWMLIAACLVGLFLRLNLLSSQVLVDDEWHSLAFVIGRSPGWILTHFSVPSGFTSIPLNIHAWLLLHTVGWSELLLRLPSVVFGLLILVLGPILVRPVIGWRAAGLLALLLAISPILVFYARLSRPYSAVACLGFLAVISAERWRAQGRLRDGVVFGVCGVLAVCWHPFAAIIIGTLGAAMLIGSLVSRSGRTLGQASAPSWWQVLCVLIAMGLAGVVLLMPALLDSFQHSMSDVAGQGGVRGASLLRLCSLTAGTANPALGILFWCLGLLGLGVLWRRNTWLAATLAVAFPLQLLALVIVRPHSCHVGIVLMRYSIIFVPVVLMLVACGLQAALTSLAARLRAKSLVLELPAYAFVASLVLAGPLPRTYATLSSFTNHGAFQHHYRAIDWSRSFDSEFKPPDLPLDTVIRTEELSGFYGFLRKQGGDRPIVEYPMMIGDHLNPHYFYQWYHGRRVLVGYRVGHAPPQPLRGNGVYGNTYVGEILNLVPDPSRLRFDNMVAMADLDRMRRMGVEYIVVHKRFEADIPRMAPPVPDLRSLLERYKGRLRTVHVDENVAVFSLDPESSSVAGFQRRLAEAEG